MVVIRIPFLVRRSPCSLTNENLSYHISYTRMKVASTPIVFSSLFILLILHALRSRLYVHDSFSLVSLEAFSRESWVSQPLFSFLRHVGNWAP